MVAGDAVVVSSLDSWAGDVFGALQGRYPRLGCGQQHLIKLRAVTFRYKQDSQGEYYGLIAKEVARIYPELVIYADGKVVTVHYHELIPMLLSEL